MDLPQLLKDIGLKVVWTLMCIYNISIPEKLVFNRGTGLCLKTQRSHKHSLCRCCVFCLYWHINTSVFSSSLHWRDCPIVDILRSKENFRPLWQTFSNCSNLQILQLSHQPYLKVTNDVLEWNVSPNYWLSLQQSLKLLSLPYTSEWHLQWLKDSEQLLPCVVFLCFVYCLWRNHPPAEGIETSDLLLTSNHNVYLISLNQKQQFIVHYETNALWFYLIVKTFTGNTKLNEALWRKVFWGGRKWKKHSAKY